MHDITNVIIFPIQNCEQKSEILKNAIVKLAQDQKELTTGMQISTYQRFWKCVNSCLHCPIIMRRLNQFLIS